MNKIEIENNTIFLFTRGSQAYGTNNEDSDEDIGAICLPSKEVLYGVEKFEQDDKWVDENGEKSDKVVYNLNKALDLMLECNPNMLDFLYAPERVIKLTTPTWQRIVDVRDEFLCLKAKWAFQGYSISQLNRIKTHRSYLLNPPKQKPERDSYDLPKKSIFPETQCEVIAKLSSQYVEPEKQDEFYSEVTKMFDREGALIFKKYIPTEYYPFAIADFKKRQKEFLHMISSISGTFLKDEYNKMAENELRYISARYNWQRYTRWQKSRNKRRGEMEAKCGYDCYSEDTEFLTENGWKSFYHISENDKLATVYIDNKSKFRKQRGIEYQNYTDKFEGEYTGNMYHFIGNHVDTLVTPNHRMLFREFSRKNNEIIGDFKLEEAHSLPDSVDFIRTISPNTKTYSNKKILPDNFPIKLETYLTLMGWFLSDGTFQFRKNKNGKKLKACAISQKQGNRLQGSMKKFYNRYNTKFSTSYYVYTKKKNKVRDYEIYEHILNIRDKDIINKLFADCGHGKDKKIPRWIFKLSKRLMEKLFDAMVRGDGTTRNTSLKSIIYYSSLKKLADDVNELAFLCGWETSLYGPYTSYKFNKIFTMYQIHVNKNTDRTRRIMALNNVKILNKNKTKIVCFTVPNKTLITRRNGHVAIHGNSKHAMHLTRLLLMAVEIMEDKGVLVDRTNIDRDMLMEIRDGLWTFEQVIELSDKLNAQADELYKTCTLPNKPNYDLINKIRLEILEAHGASLR